MRTVAVVSLKGGSGKTTLATHLALAAHLRGTDVLVADTDPQRSSYDVLTARAAEGPEVLPTTGASLMAAQFAAVGAGRQLLIVDTAAGAVEDVSEAIVLADLSILVVRPTLLDLSGLARTLRIVRRLGKPNIVVMNQAPTAREGIETPLVKRALRGLDYMKAPVAPTIVRARSIYQTALETGRSAEEMSDPIAAEEIASLWAFVEETLSNLHASNPLSLEADQAEPDEGGAEVAEEARSGAETPGQ